MERKVFVSFATSEEPFFDTRLYVRVLRLLREGFSDETISTLLQLTPEAVAVLRDHADLHDLAEIGTEISVRPGDHDPQQLALNFVEIESIGNAQDARKKVILPPGSRLWNLADFFCTKKTYDSVFCPLLADFQYEYFEALKDGREWKARWLRVLYFGAFFKSAGLNVAMRFLREAWARFHKV
jgi:hypothetical protein